MAWYDEAVFYHIYPLGLTGAPKQNSYGKPEHRLNTLLPWIDHIKEIGCNALYIGPLFESVGHGYETTDYKKLDSRLGTNEDLAGFVAQCHKNGLKVIFDGVFNHTGRDFFAFKDIQKNRENSPYRDWYCNVNFYGNTEYNDGFSYDNWGGYNLLVKLNQHNPAVKDYICDVIRFWVSEFDIDGIRLDAADVLDFNYMRQLRQVANEVKPEFWLMGEVIHGEYSRWVNGETLHSVTNYHLHKALYSGHNDHNFFEIAHTVKRLYDMGGCRPDGLKLYNFVDNHDVERIYTKLNNKAHFTPVHILLYTLPGIPSIYYGSEFGIEGRKERNSDASLRPALNLEDYKDTVNTNAHTMLIAALGKIRQATKALSYGNYDQLLLTNRQYAFARNFEGTSVITTVNNDDSDYVMTLRAGNCAEYIGALSGQKVSVSNGNIAVNVKANSGDIWVPLTSEAQTLAEENSASTTKDNPVKEEPEQEKAPIKEETPVKETSTTTKATVAEEVLAAAKTTAGKVSAVAKTTAGKVSAAAKTTAGKVSSAAKTMAEEVPSTKKTTATKESAAMKETVETVETASGNDTPAKEPTPPVPSANITPAAVAVEAPSGDTFTYDASFERGKIAGLQEAILAIMEKNGPITDQMRKDVMDNVYHDSLINWVKSFR